MCQTCISCGRCDGKVRPMAPLGKCPMCGLTNPPGAARCAGCGNPLPLPPGKTRKR